VFWTKRLPVLYVGPAAYLAESAGAVYPIDYGSEDRAAQSRNVPSKAVLRSAVVKEAWNAVRVNASSSGGAKPSAAAIAYSRPMVVQMRTGSSVLSVTGMPASTNCRMGCAAYAAAAPVTTLQERQHSTVTPLAPSARRRVLQVG
jgi:hypothetical protein